MLKSRAEDKLYDIDIYHEKHVENNRTCLSVFHTLIKQAFSANQSMHLIVIK
jgi:hypothetical protein